MWEWQSQEFDFHNDLLPAPSSSLWAKANHDAVDSWSLFNEQTPIKECTDIDLPFCDIGGIIIKDFDEGKETLQAKRRRMLQFCPENVEMDCSMTDGLLENLQVNLDFSSDEHLLHCDGTEELPEEWLVDCSQDSEHRCPPEEVNSPSAAVKANISALQTSLAEEQSTKIEKKPPQARPTPLKAGRNIIRAKKLKAASVPYPFKLIQPCVFCRRHHPEGHKPEDPCPASVQDKAQERRGPRPLPGLGHLRETRGPQDEDPHGRGKGQHHDHKNEGLSPCTTVL